MDLKLVIGLAVSFFLVVGLLLLLLWALRYQKNLSAVWKNLAPQIGFDYTEKDNEFHTQYPFRLFLCGTPPSRGANNIMRGQVRGIPTVLASYGFRTRASGVELTTICLMQNTGFKFPEFSLVSLSELNRKNFYGRTINAGIVYERARIVISEDIAFSENFVLRSVSEERIREIMTPSRRAFFVELKKSFPDFILEGNGDLLLFFRRDKKIEPNQEQCQELLEITLSIVDRFRNENA